MHILKSYNPPTTPYLDILFQDDHIVILNKQSGILSVPGKHIDHRDCLESRVLQSFPTARIIHRLDMETSGVIAIALDRDTHRNISKQFERRKTKKTYIARLYGRLENESGTIDLPLICDWPNRPKQIVDHKTGKQAVTHYEVLEREVTREGHGEVTRVQFTPVTGRSHQLRVHATTLGHPILGDKLYGNQASQAAAKRLQLHALSLSLFHPKQEKEMTFTAPLDF